MTNTWLIWGLSVASTGLAALILLLYWSVVCVELYRHGARFPVGLLPWRYFRDLRNYKEIHITEGRSLTFYFVMLVLTWAIVAVLLALAWFFWDYREMTRSLRART